jgi:hypothetical protein
VDNSQLVSVIEDNFISFQAQLKTVLSVYHGQYVLLRHGKIIDYFRDAGAAALKGEACFPDGLFSVQEVVNEPSSLGFYSHAYDIRPS